MSDEYDDNAWPVADSASVSSDSEQADRSPAPDPGSIDEHRPSDASLSLYDGLTKPQAEMYDQACAFWAEVRDGPRGRPCEP